jgi:hypothetical protein
MNTVKCQCENWCCQDSLWQVKEELMCTCFDIKTRMILLGVLTCLMLGWGKDIFINIPSVSHTHTHPQTPTHTHAHPIHTLSISVRGRPGVWMASQRILGPKMLYFSVLTVISWDTLALYHKGYISHSMRACQYYNRTLIHAMWQTQTYMITLRYILTIHKHHRTLCTAPFNTI